MHHASLFFDTSAILLDAFLLRVNISDHFYQDITTTAYVYDMVDQIDQSIDIAIPLNDSIYQDKEESEDNKIIKISSIEITTRPLYQITRNKYIDTIEEQLKEKNRILLKAYNTYAYYSCDTTEMKQKVAEHMTRTGAYALMVVLDENNQHYIGKYLDCLDQRITLTLDSLLHDKLITSSQWKKMKVYRDKGRLDSLYFLPETRRVSHRISITTFVSIMYI